MKGKGLFGKWKGMPNSARSAIVFVISSFLIKGITFLTTPIFTRLMDPTQYGIIATFNSWQLIVEVFALLGLTSAGVFNVGLNDYRECRDQYVSNVLTLCNLMTVVVFSIIFAIKYFSIKILTDFKVCGGTACIYVLNWMCLISKDINKAKLK